MKSKMESIKRKSSSDLAHIQLRCEFQTDPYFLVPFETAEPFKPLPTQGTQIAFRICVTFQMYL